MGYGSEQVLENDWLLMQEPFEGLIAKILSKKFEWLADIPKMRLQDSDSISWAKEAYSADNDPEKRFPRRLTAGADFVRVKTSKLTEGQATLAKWGFEFAVSEKARRYKKNLDVLVRALKRNANWLGDWQNSRIIASLTDSTNGVSGITSSMDFYNRSVVKWNVAGSNPVADMILFKGDYEDNNLGYTGTDFYVNMKKYRQACMYMINLDVDQGTRDALFGTPAAGATSLYIPILGATLHGMRYGIAEGDLMLLDSGMSAFTLYYDYNPEYGPSPSYAMENGQTLTNDFGLHTHEYKTDKNHEFVKQLWLENNIAVKDQSAGMRVANGAYGI